MPVPPSFWCVRDARSELLRRLTEAAVEDAEAVVEFTLAAVLGLPRLHLRLAPNRRLSPLQQETLRGLAPRLARHEPLAHVLGHTEFLGHRFIADRRGLIPRPETELLVEFALELFPDAAPRRAADVGTGSGCIAVSLALVKPAWEIWAIDLSPDALNLARDNAVHHGVESRIHWLHGNLLEGGPAGGLDLVISNPPYVPTGEIPTLAPNVREYDPRLALDGGPDGLDVVRALTPQAAAVLRPGGWLALEIGEDQAVAVGRLLAGNGFSSIVLRRDLRGVDRIVLALRR